MCKNFEKYNNKNLKNSQLTQNAIIFEHFSDVHANFLHIQLQYHAIDMQISLSGLIKCGDLSFNLSDNTIKYTIKIAWTAGWDN